MSMQFRYRLAKETFKGKKVPPKNNQVEEEFIDADQRGNQSFIKQVRVKPEASGEKSKREESLLNLGRETVTESTKSDIDNSRDVSRRNLFNFLNPATYAEEARNSSKTSKRKKRKKKKRVGSKTTEPEVVAESTERVSSSPPKYRPGLFRRFWLWLKSWFIKSSSVTLKSTVVPGENLTPDAAESTEASEEPQIHIRVVKTEEELEAEKEDQKKKILVDEEDDEEPDPDDQEVSRRNLVRQGFHFFAKPTVENISQKIETVNRSIDKITKRKAIIRPPGAITEKNFLQACTRCDACIHACPKDAIKRAPKSYGFLVMGTPYIEPIKNPCVMCDDLPCISACGDNALKPVQDIFDVRMGYAILDKKHCSAYAGSFCQQCVIDCPVPGAITQNKDMQPLFHKDICTGCGVCVRSCHTVNSPVAVKIKPQMVIDNQRLKKNLVQEKETQRLADKAADTAGAAAEAASKFLSLETKEESNQENG